MTFLEESGPDVLLYLLLVTLIPCLIFSFAWTKVFFGERKRLDNLIKTHTEVCKTCGLHTLAVVVNAFIYCVLFICFGVLIVVFASESLYAENENLRVVPLIMEESLIKFRPAFAKRMSEITEQIMSVVNITDPNMWQLSGRTTSLFHHRIDKVWERMQRTSEVSDSKLIQVNKRLVNAADATEKLQDKMMFGNFIFQKVLTMESSLRGKLCENLPAVASEHEIECNGTKSGFFSYTRHYGKIILARYIFLNISIHVRAMRSAFVKGTESTEYIPFIAFQLDPSVEERMEQLMREWSHEFAQQKRIELQLVEENTGFGIKVEEWRNTVQTYFGGVLPSIFVSSVLALFVTVPIVSGVILLAFRTDCFRNAFYISSIGNTLAVNGTNLSSALLWLFYSTPIAGLIITVVMMNVCTSSNVVVFEGQNRSFEYANGGNLTEDRIQSSSKVLKPCRKLEEIMVALGKSQALHVNNSTLLSIKIDPNEIEDSINSTVEAFKRVDTTYIHDAIIRIVDIEGELKGLYEMLSVSICDDLNGITRLISDHGIFLQSVFNKEVLTSDLRDDFNKLMDSLEAYERVVDTVSSDIDDMLLDLDDIIELENEVKQDIMEMIEFSKDWNHFTSNSSRILIECLDLSVTDGALKYASAIDEPLKKARSSGTECDLLFSVIGKAVRSTCRVYTRTVVTGCFGQIITALFLGLGTFLAYWTVTEYHQRIRWSWGDLPSLNTTHQL